MTAILLRVLTHGGRVTHICVSRLTIIGSDNGLSPGRRQAIIWTNAGILLIRTSGTNFSEILIEIHTFSFKKTHFKMWVLKMAAILCRPQCVNCLKPRWCQWVRQGEVLKQVFFFEILSILTVYLISWEQLNGHVQENLIYQHLLLTYWDRCEMVAILQKTFSNAFSWMEMCVFWFKFRSNS